MSKKNLKEAKELDNISNKFSITQTEMCIDICYSITKSSPFFYRERRFVNAYADASFDAFYSVCILE